MADTLDRLPEIPDIRMVVPCTDLDHHLDQLVGNLGFRIFSIFPADDPRVVLVERGGAFIRLEKHAEASEPGVFPQGFKAATLLEAVSDVAGIPDGDDERPDGSSAAELALSAPDEGSWRSGRAGMNYRDLIPGRLGGKLAASHIRIPEAGPVPDYVHFHSLDFQVIYCLNGWCDLVYESQGDPFRLNEGDCVLQPPGIRHRVLECSEDFEVLEISSPAEHPTFAEHFIELPDANPDPERLFGGQRFHWHIAAGLGDVRSDLGLAAPSRDAVRGELIILADNTELGLGSSTDDPAFLYVLSGSAFLSGVSNGDIKLTEGMACLIPGKPDPKVRSESASTKLLYFSFNF